MSNTGKLVVFSGFSGSGKGTIMKELMAKHGDDYALSVSATTRGPRPGEEHGREYFFISEEEFEQMIKADGLLEYAKYVDHYYGTPKSYVNEQLSAGKNVILEIEIQGALKIKKQFPDTVLMFVYRCQAECGQACGHLPGQPLHRQRREEGRSTGKDPRRVRRTGEAVHRRGQADRGAAHCPAHQLRH